MKHLGITVEMVCVQCALKYLVEQLEAGVPYDSVPSAPTFTGSIEDHTKQHHPTQEATQQERDDLLIRYAKAMEPYNAQLQAAQARKRTARFN